MSPAKGWSRLSRPGNKCGAHWRHASGWEVQHCGHPTANWPYFATSPELGPRVAIVTENGRGFRTLVQAMAAVESHLRGETTLGHEDTVKGIRRRTFEREAGHG